MVATNKVSFALYDLTAFPTITESIAHSRTNPLLIENLSDWKVIDFDGSNALVQDSTCLLKDMLYFFEDVLVEEDLPTTEYYRPEITAKRIYDCADLWYIILLVNKIFTVNKYNVEKIKYIPSSELVRIQKFVKLAKSNIREFTEDDVTEVIII